MNSDEQYDAFASALDPVMAVVTVTDGTQHAGCLVGFHGQVSIEPRRHGVWISRQNHTASLVPDAQAAAVHLLGPDDMDLAQRFGHLTGDSVDKFDGLDIEEGPLGVRLLARLPHRIAGPCTNPERSGGDHVLLVIDPTAAGTDPSQMDPLRLHDVVDIEPGHPDPA